VVDFFFPKKDLKEAFPLGRFEARSTSDPRPYFRCLGVGGIKDLFPYLIKIGYDFPPGSAYEIAHSKAVVLSGSTLGLLLLVEP